MDLESQLRLERDQPEVQRVLVEGGGQLVRRGDDPKGLYWAVIQPCTISAAPFTVRILWSVYPDQPPSVLFADGVGGSTAIISAWPAADGYRAPNDVCKPFTAEGHELHREWATGHHRWRAEGNPFLFVVETIQDDIDRVEGKRAS
ncbi:MAG: hypothetical protein JWR34_736 [Mycobacterium sp.]|nr:hypothetical protein [Mycobacterium sp.]